MILSLSTAFLWKPIAISIDINGDGSEVEVEMLRIGRVALMYQSKDKSQLALGTKPRLLGNRWVLIIVVL